MPDFEDVTGGNIARFVNDQLANFFPNLNVRPASMWLLPHSVMVRENFLSVS